MVRLFLFSLFLFTSTGFAGTVDYSKLSPQQIETDLASCPQHQPHFNLSCEQLRQIAERINDLAIQLQINRQGYGQAILAAQEKLAQQEELLDKHKDDIQLISEIAVNKQEINERLTIVKWLESPR